jgi:hypothetical protein
VLRVVVVPPFQVRLGLRQRVGVRGQGVVELA